MKFNRFDFEQQIMTCWSVVEDIKAVAEASDYTKVSEDDYQNALLGLSTLYQMKFEKLWSQFEASFRSEKENVDAAYRRGFSEAKAQFDPNYETVEESDDDEWGVESFDWPVGSAKM
jgi:hypothetical protein